MNDLSQITDLSTKLFADDASLTFGHPSLKTVKDKIHSELHKLSLWMYQNKLKLNVSKTNYVIIHINTVPMKFRLSLQITFYHLQEQNLHKLHCRL